MASKHGLGRGLNSLIRDVPGEPATPDGPGPDGGSIEVPVARIRANPNQPRRRFAAEALDDMVRSIKVHGVIQPLLLRRAGADYELVAGERRLRAARLAGLDTVPARVKDVGDRDALELTLIENLQREDLNPIEEAEGYQSLASQFGLSQDDIAARVGKARATVANALRLLGLPPGIKQRLSDGVLSAGHAKALLAAALDEDKEALARRTVAEGWSVRELEQAVAHLARPPRKPRASRDDVPAPTLRDLTDRLQRHFGTGVRLIPSRTLANGKKGRGRLEIEFYSNDDLTRVLELIGLPEA